MHVHLSGCLHMQEVQISGLTVGACQLSAPNGHGTTFNVTAISYNNS